MMIPPEDFTYVTLASEDTEDDYDGHEDLDDHDDPDNHDEQNVGMDENG